MNHPILKIFLVVAFGFTACTANPAKPMETDESLSPASVTEIGRQPTIHTTMGDFVIPSARFVDEVNGEKPGPGEKLLLVALTTPEMDNLDPSHLSLEEFQNMVQNTDQGTIHILGEDGSQTISSMAGWVGPEYKEFVIGFRVPDTVATFQLVWPGNDPLAIIPDE